VIDVGSSAQGARGEVSRSDLSQIVLPVVPASESELRAHEEWLKDLDKASGGKAVWRRLEGTGA
jgi:DNA polymerase-3 subunit epsilon